MKLAEIDLSISRFTGPLMENGKQKQRLCDVCGREQAMWVHVLKKDSTKRAYLCFGCGGH